MIRTHRNFTFTRHSKAKKIGARLLAEMVPLSSRCCQPPVGRVKDMPVGKSAGYGQPLKTNVSKARTTTQVVFDTHQDSLTGKETDNETLGYAKWRPLALR